MMTFNPVGSASNTASHEIIEAAPSVARSSTTGMPDTRVIETWLPTHALRVSTLILHIFPSPLRPDPRPLFPADVPQLFVENLR